MRISDWSSDVCSSDLLQFAVLQRNGAAVEDDPVGMALAVDPVFGRELVAVDADHAGWPRRDARVGLRGERACEQAQGGGEEEGVLRHRIGPASAWRFRVSATGRNAGVDDATTTQSAPARSEEHTSE